MIHIWITFCKELRSMFRDKKTLYTLLIFPILIPVMIFLYAYMYETESEEEKYLVGVNYEMNTVELSLFEEMRLESKVYNQVDEMKKAYDKGEIFGYIDYQEEDKKYILYTNEDSEEGMYVSSYVSNYLESYNTYLAKLTLIGEDVDVDTIYNNFTYEIVNLEGENWILMLMFTISFTYIVMSIVISTTNMATTATAVEKENGTLETLLTFPVRSRDLVLGKYLATVFMGLLSSFIGLSLTVGSLKIATEMFSAFDGITYSINVVSILQAILIILLASFFIAGLSIAVTSFAKTYKEAQSMSSVLNILTVIPMMISIIGVTISQVYYFIPILNYTQILMDIFSGTVTWSSIMIVLVSSIIYVVIVISYIIRQYRTEKVLFGI